VESFNGRLRDECLNETLFASLSHARSVLCNWREDYNNVRPLSGIGGLTPADAARRLVIVITGTSEQLPRDISSSY
jgi:putative transposase